LDSSLFSFELNLDGHFAEQTPLRWTKRPLFHILPQARVDGQ
jgi:hypothetical protein